MNSQTDFAAGNAELTLLHAVANVLLNLHLQMLKKLALKVSDDQTVNDMIIHTTQITGEKITLRRFAVVEKAEGQVFGTYSTWVVVFHLF